jgi:hypothetical protein
MEALWPSIDRLESRRFAFIAVETAHENRRRWKINSQPWINNGLVNLKLKEYGLCFQWADYLLFSLDSALPKEMVMVKIFRDRGRLNEHHAICLYQKGENWKHGLLLDGWRKAGILEFYPVSQEIRKWNTR